MQGLRYTFPKQQRLSGNHNIQTLLSKGEAFFVHPYRVVYTISAAVHPSDAFTKVLISVPKRKCKLAVLRNGVKRQTREAYRQHQHIVSPIIGTSAMQLTIMLQYTQSTALPSAMAALAMQKILIKLQKMMLANE